MDETLCDSAEMPNLMAEFLMAFHLITFTTDFLFLSMTLEKIIATVHQMKRTITLKKMTVAWGLNIAGPILNGVITEMRILILTVVCKKSFKFS